MVLALPLAIWYQDLFGKYAVEGVQRLGTTVLFLWMFFSSLLGLLCGNGILKGQSWARILALAYCVVATLIGAVFYQGHPLNWSSITANVVFTVIMGFFLYRPDATAFFQGEMVFGRARNCVT